MFGLSKTSTIKETIVKVNDSTAIKYKVVEETIDIGALKAELDSLKAMTEPSREELADMGRMIHSYYMGREDRIKDLETKLKEITG